MHVLLVTTSYPDTLSGSEAAGSFVADFAEQLARHVRVTVVAVTRGDSSQRTEGRVEVYRFKVRRWPLSQLKPYNPLDWWPIVATLRDGLRTVRRVFDTDRPDYVLALWALPSGYWARRMLTEFGVPYGTWSLGSDIWSLGRVPVVRSYLGRVLASAERRYADGLRLGHEVERLSGKPCDFLPSSRSLAVQETTDPAGSAPYRLAYLGRWHPNKGVDLFLQALQSLSAEDWSRIAEVRVHGGGPLEFEVCRLVDELREQGRPISAGGYLDTEAAADFIAWSDYLVLPSRIESIPVIFSDAAQVRRPLVATPVGDLPGLFEEHEFGILAADASATALADALRKALRTPANQFRPQLDVLAAKFDVAVAARRLAERLSGNAS
ncbi:MAG TPA: glycosyltransferase [Woeseiaceae bacterium]|jgi:glycosyltransferase involved in cell wall biosynthesis|nr:glycosyltransferase [Woeseiaceae bacterium]